MRLLIEGWRNIPHSYALVNCFQILELLKRSDVELYFREVPYFAERWRPMRGLFLEEEERLLNDLRLWSGEEVDAIYRISFPGDLGPPVCEGAPVFVFLTAEYQRFMPDFFVNGTSEDIGERTWLHFITPSRWSSEAFKGCGRPTEVVPHGVDSTKFYPLSPEERLVGRAELGVEGKFIWLNIGAMTGNKGLDLLLRAFTEISSREEESVLLLKGLGDLYNSQRFLEQWLEVIPGSERSAVKEKILFSEASLPFEEVNKLYNVADCYVAPYRAEGFNLPVLEAAACGLCSIISAQGSTEDFTNPGFVRYIATEKVTKSGKVLLEPDVNDLVKQMESVREDADFRAQAGVFGRSHVQQNYKWERVVDALLATISGVLLEEEVVL